MKNKVWIRLASSPRGIRFLKFDSEGNFYAAVSNQGLYVSTDFGKIWEKRNSGLNSYHITDILSSFPNQIILGTFDLGLYSSINDGLSWRPINSGIKSVSITCFLQYKDFLFAGSEQGIIYRTLDLGDSWERIDSNYTLNAIHCFGKSDKGSLFFTNYHGIFKSNDEGKTWYKVSNLYGFSFANYALPNLNMEYIFVACEANGIYFSTNEGENWFPLRNPLKEMWVRKIAVNSRGDLYALSGNKIFRTSEMGRTWEKVYQGNNEVYSECI